MNINPPVLNLVDDIMVTKVPVARQSDTVAHILGMLSKDGWQDIHSIYVVSQEGILQGVIPIHTLLISDRQESIEKIMDTIKVVAYPHMAQEKIVLEAIKHDVQFVPVVDKDNRFLGAITSDQIIDILHRERHKHAGTLLGMVGIQGKHTSRTIDEYFKEPIIDSIKARIPFLIIGLFGGVLAAQIISGFEHALEKQIILAAFIPMVVYMADAIGTQTETIFVRNVALDSKMKLQRFLIRELLVGMGVALICGVLVSIYSFIRYNSLYLGLVLGPSLFLATFFAIIIGGFVPWLIFRFKKDPAIGTGPLSTIVQDMASVTAYFLIATALLNVFS